jgi:hypothetical protein
VHPAAKAARTLEQPPFRVDHREDALSPLARRTAKFCQCPAGTAIHLALATAALAERSSRVVSPHARRSGCGDPARLGTRVAGRRRSLDITVGTARNHLKAIFLKTGAHRQSELMALMQRIRYRAPSNSR